MMESSYTQLPYSGITISAGPISDRATISGLTYGQAYTFRVRATTYEDGPYSSSVDLDRQTYEEGSRSFSPSLFTFFRYN